MSPRRWTFTGWALAVSAALGVGLLGLILHLQGRVGAARAEYALAKSGKETLETWRLRYRELEDRKRRMPPQSTGPSGSWLEFLAQKASEAGLPTPSFATELPVKGGPWKESPFTVTIDAGSGGSLSRKSFVRFLDLVETQRPGFKSKNLGLRFAVERAPEDLTRANVTFSHFEKP